MKRLFKVGAVALCTAVLAASSAGCANGNNEPKINIIPDPNPYTFNNDDNKPRAEYDADMKIDGKFEEEKWSSVRWLHGEDNPNSVQSAEIDFTMFVGQKGLFIGAKVEEKNCNIWVNPDRGSWTNSCLELYIGPIGQAKNNEKTYEFDIQADGTTGNMRLMNPERDMKTTWDKMPVIAAQQLGGKVNTPECTGYHIECFIPWAYLEMGGWDVSKPEELVVGIDPVHIFSLRYDGEEVDQNITSTRIWSRWTEKILPNMGWLEPDTYFRFKDGIMAYGYEVKSSGEGKGTITTKTGWNYVFGWGTSTFVITPRNGAVIKSLKVDGVDYLDRLVDAHGSYEFDVSNPTDDITIEVEYGY